MTVRAVIAIPEFPLAKYGSLSLITLCEIISDRITELQEVHAEFKRDPILNKIATVFEKLPDLDREWVSDFNDNMESFYQWGDVRSVMIITKTIH